MSRRAWTISGAPALADCRGSAAGERQQRSNDARHAAFQPILPRLPHQAAAGEPAIWAGTVDEHAQRQGRRHARRDQQRHAAHAGLQISLQAGRDRRHRRLHQNHSRAVRRAAAGESRPVARRRLEIWRTPCAVVSSSRTSPPSPPS